MGHVCALLAENSIVSVLQEDDRCLRGLHRKSSRLSEDITSKGYIPTVVGVERVQAVQHV